LVTGFGLSRAQREWGVSKERRQKFESAPADRTGVIGYVRNEGDRKRGG